MSCRRRSNDPSEIADFDNDGVGDNEDRRSPEIIANLESQITRLQMEISQLVQRLTIEQLQDARNGSVIISADKETATISFNIEESNDLKTWQNTGDKITKTIQLKEGKKFYRFALDK